MRISRASHETEIIIILKKHRSRPKKILRSTKIFETKIKMFINLNLIQNEKSSDCTRDMFRYFSSIQCNSAIYCATRFIHGKQENPLNIRNITSNVYLGAIIFPCLNMLMWRVRSIAIDESGKNNR